MSCTNCNQSILPPVIISGPPGPAGTNGIDGMYGGVCTAHQFSASTSGADPGSGLISIDTSIMNLATHMYINYTDIVGTDITTFLDSLDLPTNPVKALIRITSKTDPTLFAIFEVNDVTPGSGYVDFDINYLSGSVNPFSAGDDILFCPALSGSSTINFLTISPDWVTGVDYPASSVGDVYHVLTPGWVGTTAGLEPPSSVRVFKDDMLFCIANTAGGDQAAAGASFFVWSASRAFVPESTTNGDDNFVLNTDALTNNTVAGSSEKNVIMGNLNIVNNSIGNFILGSGDGTSGHTVTSSVENIVSGNQFNINGSSHNVITGNLSVLVDSENNVVAGFQNNVFEGDNNLIAGLSNALLDSIQGDNNVIAGKLNTILASDNLVVGESNYLEADTIAGSLRSLVAGASSFVNIANSMTLGATDSPASFSGRGSFQSMIVPLAGTVTNVISPIAQYINLTSNAFAGANSYLEIPNNTIWYYDLHIVVVQKGVGSRHINSSTVGDSVGYEISGMVQNVGGTITQHNIKYKTARGQIIQVTPPTSPPPQVRRFMKVTDGSQSDIQLVIPVIRIAGAVLTIDLYFPGFQGDMPSSTVTEPAFGELFAGVTLTGDGVTTGVIAGPTVAATYRNPYVDIYGGYGLDGGSGVGAVATAELTPTTVANNLYICSGGTGYSDGTLTFSSGDATGTYTTTGGVVTGATITGGTAVYTTPPLITAFSNPGVGANVIAYLTPTTVDNIDVTESGAGYTAIPNAVVYDGGSTQCGAGNGGSFVAAGTIKITQLKF